MPDSSIEALIDDWQTQSREVLKNYFTAKENNDATQMEIIQKTMDKFSQQFVSLLKEDLRKGKYKEQLDKISEYFSESGYLSFNQMFDFENKVLISVEQGVKSQTKNGFVNDQINNKIMQLLSKLISNEVSFHNLLKSLISDFNYITKLVDSISGSQNLVRWLKHVSVKANKTLLSATEYKNLNKLVDTLFGKVPVSGVSIPKKDQIKRELFSNKLLTYLSKSEEYETEKKELYNKLIIFISNLKKFDNYTLTVHDTRNLFDYNNKIRFVTEKQKEILHHIQSIVDHCKKFATYVPNLSVNCLSNVEIRYESDTYTDLLEIQGKIKRQTST
jgi:hypothetical protein